MFCAWRNLCQLNALKLFCLNLDSSFFCAFVVRKAKWFSCHFTPVWAFYPPSPGVHVHKRTLSVLNPFSVVRRALCVTITVVPVALIQCYRTWVGKILRHVGRSPIWQSFFKIKTGNVRISFPNDLRELHCPYLTRGSAKYPFQFQRNSSTINAHKYSFFVRTVPAWNVLSPVSVCAVSVAVFHSRSVDHFYLFYYFFFCCIKNHEYSLRFKKTIL